MEFGLTIPHTGRNASPDWVRDYATVADEAGWDSLWGVDHLVMPQRTDSEYTLGRKPAKIADDAVSGLLSPNYEMMTTLTWIAGFTERIKLGTAVAVLPIRNAVQNARILATLDVYSGGRVLYGVGVGWLREEAEAMGMPWDRRGARSEEHIALLRTLWCAEGDLVEFHGEFHDLPPMDPEPRPVQRPIPILVGGHSDIALERAGRIGDGWIAAQMSPERVAEHWPKVQAAAEKAGRDPGWLLLFTSISGRSDLPLGDLLGQYRELGVDHVQLGLHRQNREGTLDMIRDVADNVLPDLRH
jgi:probable F420-dependent oxidoreductase